MMKRIFAILTALAVLGSCSSGLAETILKDVMGEIDAENGTYTNAFFGIGCSNPDWEYCEEEEILSLNRFTEDWMEKDLKTILKSSEYIMLMTTEPDMAGALYCVSIRVSRFVYWNIREMIKQTGIEAAMPGMRYDMIKAFKAHGMEDVEVQIDTVTIDGSDEAAFIVQYTDKGERVCLVEAVLPYGDYYVIIEAAAAPENMEEAKAAFSSFYWLNEPETQP